MLFKVMSKRTGITYDVYSVKDAHFLIFFKGEFRWQPMNNFRPTKTTEQEMLEERDNASKLFKSQRKQVLYP